MNPVLNDILPSMDELKSRLSGLEVARENGQVEQIVGLVIESLGPASSIGEACWITPNEPHLPPVLAEVVGFRQNRVLLMPLGEMRGLGPGSQVVKTGAPFKIAVGDALLGRTLDAMGGGPPPATARAPCRI
jgi:flagellum-specific ATP synthase